MLRLAYAEVKKKSRASRGVWVTGPADEKPLLLTGENTGVRQGVEVSGHVGLTRSRLFNELADVPGTSHESHNQPETHWLAQGAEALGNQLNRSI